jgi:hypothetical protein
VQLRAGLLSVYAGCLAIVGGVEETAHVLGLLTDLVGDEPEDPLLRSGLTGIRSFALLRQGRFTDAIPRRCAVWRYRRGWADRTTFVRAGERGIRSSRSVT